MTTTRIKEKQMGNCQACGRYTALDRAHIKTKGSGGSWEVENLLMLCRKDHTAQHSLGFVKFIARHPHLIQVLRDKGWELETLFGKTSLKRI